MKTEGQETSEWGAMQWIKWSSGLASGILLSLVVALPLSGALDSNSLVLVVMGIAASVLAVVAGKAVSTYTGSRTESKVAKAKAYAAQQPQNLASTPQLIDLDELKKMFRGEEDKASEA